MNYATLAASVRGTISDVHFGIMSTDTAVKSIMLIFMVESWDHVAAEVLRVSDLTDAEYRTVDSWAKDTKSDYDSKIQHIKDMRQVFPGLSLTAAKHFAD
jgi:ribosomal protein L7/L12